MYMGTALRKFTRPPGGEALERFEGRVSTVERATPMDLICKVLCPSISTCETPPLFLCARRLWLRPSGATGLWASYALDIYHVIIQTRATFVGPCTGARPRSEEHTSELQSLRQLVCRLMLEKKNKHSIVL